ncbi:hypothetical protein XELAEV_18026424mg [Xenopus laevis]|uniref:Uncharacterized protein n=1 Tax=Xenopus laevis TaxID=8355 RepID=A0A974CW35_XENLA|nr:hypothetical protein XELAEV_18026424mg [Xenopus laevis]
MCLAYRYNCLNSQPRLLQSGFNYQPSYKVKSPELLVPILMGHRVTRAFTLSTDRIYSHRSFSASTDAT